MEIGIVLSLTAAIAFLIDALLGDPMWIPHPIIYIGRLISVFEGFLRRLFPETKSGLIIAGTILWVLVISTSFILPLVIIYLLYTINVYLAAALNCFWSFQILAAKSLETEAFKIKRSLECGNVSESRQGLSMIVGRDTSSLSEEEIAKAVVETVSENTTDGVVAPLLFLVIGGSPLGFLYKAVNTLDSMVGYKSDKYIYFGRASAILDDVFNYIPARITGIAMVASSAFLGMNYREAFKVMLKDHRKHASPNGGWTEGATAGALNITLGGDAYYFGRLYKKAELGHGKEKVTPEKIVDTVGLMWFSSILAGGLFITCRIALEIFI